MNFKALEKRRVAAARELCDLKAVICHLDAVIQAVKERRETIVTHQVYTNRIRERVADTSIELEHLNTLEIALILFEMLGETHFIDSIMALDPSNIEPHTCEVCPRT